MVDSRCGWAIAAGGCDRRYSTVGYGFGCCPVLYDQRRRVSPTVLPCMPYRTAVSYTHTHTHRHDVYIQDALLGRHELEVDDVGCGGRRGAGHGTTRVGEFG